ncbi:amidase family protein [Sphingomonas hankookensis]|uniref:amidase family protein n=1 Tax=Sphingomonas hankookensis TaxID=563996 RepID=UPI003F79832D
MVARMRAAGAIFVGKTNVPEFALGSHSFNPLFGITRNAWNPAKTAGGSTGGGAVALALGMVPLADGSDFGGSLRNPAGWNHVFGFRPSFGRVPSVPSSDVFWQNFATAGPMARSVRDLALLLSVQAGPDRRAPSRCPTIRPSLQVRWHATGKGAGSAGWAIWTARCRWRTACSTPAGVLSKRSARSE